MKKLLSILLCALLTFSFVACGGDKDGDGAEKPSGETVNFSEKGFTIIYLTGDTAALKLGAKIYNAVKDAGGNKLNNRSDEEAVNTAGEILIGETNRPQSKTAMDKLEAASATKLGDYGIYFIDGSVCIVAANSTGYEAAIAAFIDGYCKDFKVPTNLETVFTGGADVVVEYADNTELFKYCGVWQPIIGDTKTYSGSWNVKYVEVDFTGTEITLSFPQKSKFQLKVDNGEYTEYIEHTGDYKLTVTGDGKHTVRVYNGDYRTKIYFGGASVPAGQTLSRTADKEHYVEFIGDSITEMGVLYKAAEALNWDHSTVAKSGITLCTRNNRIFPKNFPTLYSHFGDVSPGMDVAHFRTDYIGADDISRFGDYLNNDSVYKYDCNTGYYPDIVYIFLGTNDPIETNSDQGFIESYVNFVRKLKAHYGDDTKFIIMNSIYLNTGSARHNTIRAAAEILENEFPGAISFIDNDLISAWGVKPGPDGCHPDQAGYELLAECMQAYLKNLG